MISPSLSSFSLSISLFFLILFPLQATSAANLILNTCKICSQQDPNVKLNFCTSSLQAAPASHCADLHGLGMISIRLTRYNLTDTRCFIKQLLSNTKKMDPYVRACLNDCFELYSDAIPTVKLAMKYYNSKQYVDANIQISSVMDAATSCEDGFSERKGVVSPLTKRNNATFELSAMVLSIMHILQSGSNRFLDSCFNTTITT